MLLIRLDKASIEFILVCCIFRWYISWTKQHYRWVLYGWNPIERLDVCWWYLCVL